MWAGEAARLRLCTTTKVQPPGCIKEKDAASAGVGGQNLRSGGLDAG